MLTLAGRKVASWGEKLFMKNGKRANENGKFSNFHHTKKKDLNTQKKTKIVLNKFSSKKKLLFN